MNIMVLRKKKKGEGNKGLIPVKKINTNSKLKKSKSDLIEKKKRILVKKIEAAIIELVYSVDEQKHAALPEYLNEKLNYNYNYLADIFSKIKRTTLKTFIITTKTERVKELLIKDEYSIAEIASILHYKNVSHLSSQFKKITGITPSYFLASQWQMDNNSK